MKSRGMSHTVSFLCHREGNGSDINFRGKFILKQKLAETEPHKMTIKSPITPPKVLNIYEEQRCKIVISSSLVVFAEDIYE